MRKSKKFKVLNMLTALFMILGMFTNVSSKAFAESTKNLIGNASFEDGEQGKWTPRGDVKLEVTKETKAADGEYSLKVTSRTQNWNGPSYSVKDTLEKGRTYNISVKVKAVAGEKALGKEEKVTLSMEKAVDNGDSSYSNIASADINEDTWVTVGKDYTLDYTGELTKLEIYVESSTVNLEFYIDDLLITDVTPVDKGNIISNGTFENGVTGWDNEGTVNLESSSDFYHQGSHSLRV